jgi:hypothetical protein
VLNDEIEKKSIKKDKKKPTQVNPSYPVKYGIRIVRPR